MFDNAEIQFVADQLPGRRVSCNDLGFHFQKDRTHSQSRPKARENADRTGLADFGYRSLQTRQLPVQPAHPVSVSH